MSFQTECTYSSLGALTAPYRGGGEGGFVYLKPPSPTSMHAAFDFVLLRTRTYSTVLNYSQSLQLTRLGHFNRRSCDQKCPNYGGSALKLMAGRIGVSGQLSHMGGTIGKKKKTQHQSTGWDAIAAFNGEVACCKQLSVEGVQDASHHQYKLSSAIEMAGFILWPLDGASIKRPSLLHKHMHG